MTEMDEQAPQPEQDLPESVWFVSQDRSQVKFEVEGVDYEATRPKKWSEWATAFSVSMAVSEDDWERPVQVMEKFGRKVLGDQQFRLLSDRFLDDEDPATYDDMVSAFRDLFAVWTSEADQPIRPTGSPAASSSSKKRPGRRSTGNSSSKG